MGFEGFQFEMPQSRTDVGASLEDASEHFVRAKNFTAQIKAWFHAHHASYARIDEAQKSSENLEATMHDFDTMVQFLIENGISVEEIQQTAQEVCSQSFLDLWQSNLTHATGWEKLRQLPDFALVKTVDSLEKIFDQVANSFSEEAIIAWAGKNGLLDFDATQFFVEISHELLMQVPLKPVAAGTISIFTNQSAENSIDILMAGWLLFATYVITMFVLQARDVTRAREEFLSLIEKGKISLSPEHASRIFSRAWLTRIQKKINEFSVRGSELVLVHANELIALGNVTAQTGNPLALASLAYAGTEIVSASLEE